MGEGYIRQIAKELNIPRYRVVMLLDLRKDARKAQKYSAFCANKNFGKKTSGVPTSVLMAMTILYSKFCRRAIDGENNILAMRKCGSTLNSGQKTVKRTKIFTYVRNCPVLKLSFPSYASRLDCMLDFVNEIASNKEYKQCFDYKDTEDFLVKYRKSLRSRWQKTMEERLLSVMDQYALESFNLSFSEIWGGLDATQDQHSWFGDDSQRRRIFYRTVLEKH